MPRSVDMDVTRILRLTVSCISILDRLLQMSPELVRNVGLTTQITEVKQEMPAKLSMVRPPYRT